MSDYIWPDRPFPWSQKDQVIMDRLSAIFEAAKLTVVGVFNVEQGLDYRVETCGGVATVRCRCGRRGLLPDVEPIDGHGDSEHARAFMGRALTDWALTQMDPDAWLANDYCWVNVVNAALVAP